MNNIPYSNFNQYPPSIKLQSNPHQYHPSKTQSILSSFKPTSVYSLHQASVNILPPSNLPQYSLSIILFHQYPPFIKIPIKILSSSRYPSISSLHQIPHQFIPQLNSPLISSFHQTTKRYISLLNFPSISSLHKASINILSPLNPIICFRIFITNKPLSYLLSKPHPLKSALHKTLHQYPLPLSNLYQCSLSIKHSLNILPPTKPHQYSPSV